MSALSPSQQPTVLFSIYQNNTRTIRRLVDEMIDPLTQRIILKIVGFGKSDSTSSILTLKFSHAVPSEHKTYNSNSEQKSEI